MAEAISLAKELNDMHALAVALWNAGNLGQFERNAAKVERLASDLIELSTRHQFASWLAGGEVLRGWARSACGDTAEGIARIKEGIRDYRGTGAVLRLPYFLALKAEALHLADRTSEALEAIKEAEALAARSEGRWWCAEMHRLRGVFLASLKENMTIRKVEIERFSVTSSKAVVAVLEAAVGRPDMVEFVKATKGARTFAELESTVHKRLGRTGLMTSIPPFIC